MMDACEIFDEVHLGSCNDYVDHFSSRSSEVLSMSKPQVQQKAKGSLKGSKKGFGQEKNGFDMIEHCDSINMDLALRIHNYC